MPAALDVLHSRPWRSPVRRRWRAPWGFLGESEGRLLYYLARDYYEGAGTIVDAGSFLGRSAWFLARGLEANRRLASRSAARIHCFDNFTVNDTLTSERLNQQFGPAGRRPGVRGLLRGYLQSSLRAAPAREFCARVGDSTRHLFDEATGPVSQLLEVHEGDFHTYDWAPRPIEILFVDLAKSASLHRRLVELMYPCLIAGRSVIVHQDYHHPWLPHIHLAMEYLNEYFEIVEPGIDDSAVFRCVRAIPEHAVSVAANIDDLPFSERLTLMDRALDRLPRDCRHYVELARANLIGRARGFDAMQKALEAIDVAARLRQRDPRWLEARAEMANVLTELSRDLSPAWRMVDAGRIENALAVAAAITPDDPHYADALLLKAHCLRLQGHLDLAAEALAPAETLAANVPILWIERAWLDLALGKPALAVQSARRALALTQAGTDPEAYALHVLAAALSETGANDQALEAIDRALDAKPGEPVFLRQRADCLVRAAQPN